MPSLLPSSKFCVSLLGRALLPSLCSLVILISGWQQTGRRGTAMRSRKVTFGSGQPSEREGRRMCFSAYPVVFLTTLFLGKGLRTQPRSICHTGNQDRFALKALQNNSCKQGILCSVPFCKHEIKTLMWKMSLSPAEKKQSVSHSENCLSTERKGAGIFKKFPSLLPPLLRITFC